MTTTTSDCPFSVGDEVTITDGFGGKPLEIDRVRGVYFRERDQQGYPAGFRILLDASRSKFLLDSLGYASHYGMKRRYITLATDGDRQTVYREKLIISLERCRRWRSMPTPALEETHKLLEAYLPSMPAKVSIH